VGQHGFAEPGRLGAGQQVRIEGHAHADGTDVEWLWLVAAAGHESGGQVRAERVTDHGMVQDEAAYPDCEAGEDVSVEVQGRVGGGQGGDACRSIVDLGLELNGCYRGRRDHAVAEVEGVGGVGPDGVGVFEVEPAPQQPGLRRAAEFAA